MNLLCDEGADRQIVERLRRDGHDVLYVAEMELGISDDVVLQRANEHQALLVTEDKDFGELVFRQELVHGGVVLVRLFNVSSETKAAVIAGVFAEHGEELQTAFTVISSGMVRIRKRQG